MDDVLRVKVEHNYQTPFGVNAAENLRMMKVDPNDQMQDSKVDPEDALVEFIHVSNLASVTKCVEEKIETWRHRDLISDNRDPLSSEMLAYRRKYEKRIQALQILIADVVSLASKRGEPNTNFEVEKNKISSCMQRNIISKEMQRCNCTNLQRHLSDSQKENTNLLDQLKIYKDDIDRTFRNMSIIKKSLTVKQKQCMDLEGKCTILKKQLDNSTQDMLDMVIIKTWLDDTLKSQQVFKRKLTQLNEDVQSMRRTLTCNLQTKRKRGIARGKKKIRRFYVLERQHWLETQDCVLAEIDWEFDILRENLLMLKHDLEPKVEPYNVTDVEFQILQEEVFLKDEPLEVE